MTNPPPPFTYTLPAPDQVYNITNFIASVSSMYGFLAYVIAFLFPLSVWIKTKSLSLTGMALVLIGVGFTAVSNVNIFTKLIVGVLGLIIGALLLRAYWWER